jgi:hypothetical protein
MQGIPLAGDFGHPLQTPEQRRNMEALLDDNPTGPRDNEVIKAAKDAMIYGTGFVQMQGEDRMPGGDKPTEMELLRRPPVTSDLKQFENSYGTDFGTAILQMRAGCKVQREGWNGKDMWIALSGVEGPREVYSEKARDYARAQPGGTVKVLPCFIMKTATGEILMGWLASQSDMLAQDWRVVP